MKKKTKTNELDTKITVEKSSSGIDANNGKSLMKDFKSIIIENVTPEVDNGKFPAKATVGEIVTVEANIFREGHDKISAALKYKMKGSSSWTEVLMKHMGNDRWQATFIPDENTSYFYTVESWLDPIATWYDGIEKKCRSSIKVNSEVLEGLKLFNELSHDLSSSNKQILTKYTQQLEVSQGFPDEVLRIISNGNFKSLIFLKPLKKIVSIYEKELEIISDRKLAEFGTWYELFPRSQGSSNKTSGTFKDCINTLPRIKKMGFNIIYLPPIHPIGSTNRKGKNNTLVADKDSPGSPWAIGNKEGGHKAIHPELGTIEDFVELVDAAKKYEIEIALDFAIQCSPDHPYAKEHPEWFYHLPDGTIKYAENPPKKYEDIYPVNFYCENRKELWEEMKSILLYWIDKGVKIFRVDNPHTKPLNFWRWVIREIKNQYPEVIFLAEAFTRPNIMKYLAKAGFTQSYTYFTWRNSKPELIEYLTELTQSDMKNFFRGNFFTNTPDILHEYLQAGGEPAFKIRYVLAATLSSSCGIYSGYELCENIPKEKGSEEYLNSEKYEIKVRDWTKGTNISDFIATVNLIRSDNPALQQYKNLEFYDSNNSSVLCYGKRTLDNSNIIVVAINLDPFNTHEDTITLPLSQFGVDDWQKYQMKDLITGEKYYWKGSSNYIKLDPKNEPAHIFCLKK